MEADVDAGHEDNNSRAGLDPESETARTLDTGHTDTSDTGQGRASLYKSP